MDRGPRDVAGHTPVLVEETLQWLDPRRGGVYVDATLGAGGHAEAILERIVPGGRLVGIDRDDDAIALASQRLARFGEAVVIVRENFAAIKEVLSAVGLARVDGVLFDLGASSMQFASSERGFSFAAGGPLDMRMDRRQPLRAADLVNRMSERDLADVIYRYGQDRWSRRIARAIVGNRPVATAAELAEIVSRAVPRRSWPRGIHPATRTFQALRIAVNDELTNLENAIPDAAEVLRESGRLCAITFHSLEDHTIKHTFLRLSRGCARSPGSSADISEGKPCLRILTKKPVVPSPQELASNPRARSAKLRAAERI
ncbi:MAG TPA: 16S rRNA (cytosine(1402)-N(4))-methyltransferase RsmH [bacterium]|jgi:16S rRNA (cytosine1402-N4)-methyltransferase|nr:16S rRNA (cytosine(1402)-N(4))-methyltransferase RsmH [bacterium]